MALKPEQVPALTHEERVQRLQQLTDDLEKAVDLAEEQRRLLRGLAREANDLAESLSGEPPAPHNRRPGKKR
jgi:hypothetical protein